MERKIGEIFEQNGEWYQCLESNRCLYCDLEGLVDCSSTACASGERSDGKEVHFKKLKKVGEPYEKRVSDGSFSKFQRYKVYDSVILPKEPYIYCNFIDSTVEIEIKQVKDMGERDDIRPYDEYFSQGTVSNTKHLPKSNLKPFDLQKAKDGKPVCTRDGRKARIICFDAKGDFPIVALVETNNIEEVYHYTNNGLFFHLESNDLERVDDLMMLPEKKEGWVNIVRGSDGGRPHMGRGIFQSKEEAENAIKAFSDNLIDIVKISWEEQP